MPGERPPELEITINAVEFEDAVEQFKLGCVKMLGDHADNLAMLFRDRLLRSIAAEVEGRPVRLTIITEPDERPAT